MSRRPLLAVTLLLCLAAPAAHALPTHGGTGGAAFDLDCRGDSVLVGIHVRSGTLIDRVEPVCVQVNVDGTWKSKFGVGAAGGTGGALTSLICPSNQAVAGIMGAAAVMVDSLGITCGSVGRVSEVIQITAAGAKLGPVGGTGGTPFSDTCPTGQIGRGLRGRSATLIDQIELTCGNPHPLVATAEKAVGAVLGINPSRLSDPALAASGTGYLLAHIRYSPGSGTLFAQRLSTLGQPTGLPVQLGSTSNLPGVAFGGGNYLVVWNDDLSDNVRGVRFSAAGTRLDATPIAITQSGKARNPAVAFNGTHFVIVWEDGSPGWDATDIRAARMNTSGAVIETSGIAILQKAGAQTYPAIGCVTGSCLITWRDRADSDRANGTLLGNNGVVGTGLSGVCPTGSWPASVVSGGSAYLATCSIPGGTLGFVRISAAAVLLDAAPIRFNTAATNPLIGRVATAFDGTNYLLAWPTYVAASGTGDVAAVRVSPAGTLLDTTPVMLTTAPNIQPSAAVAGAAGQFMAAWPDARNDTGPDPNNSVSAKCDIFGTRISGAGAVLDPAGVDLRPIGNQQVGPAIAFDGAYFLIVWQDDRTGDGGDIYGLRVSATGVGKPATQIAIATAAKRQAQPAVVFDGTDFLVVWSDERGSPPTGYESDIYCTRVTTAGAVRDPNGVFVSGGGRRATQPRVAHGAGHYLVTWTDERSSPAGQSHHEIYAAQVRKSDMAIVQETGILLQAKSITNNTLTDYSAPDVAWDGTNFLVVWQSSWGDLGGKRVGPTGAVVDAAPIVISNATGTQARPRVAAQPGTQYLVVWDDSRAADIRGQRITTAGVLSGGEIIIGNAANAQSSPAVGIDGATWTVAWADTRAGATKSDIYATRVDGKGAVHSSLGAVVSNGADFESAPALPATGYLEGQSVIVYQRNLVSLPPGERVRIRILQVR